MRHAARILSALLAATMASFAYAGAANAATLNKTITTSNGECVNSGNPPTLADGTTPCGTAVYGTTGFAGTIYGNGSLTLQDYICVHTSGDGPFKSYGGTYTFTAYDAGNAVLASIVETVTGGVACTGKLNAVTSGSISVDFDANGGSVTYSLSVSGVTPANAANTFSTYNVIRNRVVSDASHANSPAVGPPAAPAATLSKTITTSNGECVNNGNPSTLVDGTTPCGAAVYGASGFSGTIYAAGTRTLQDYICVHTLRDATFKSYGGTYTFTVYDAGKAVLASTLAVVIGGVDCTPGSNAATPGSITVDFDANGGSVTYSVSISGVTAANAADTFSSYNLILNRVISDIEEANSPAVSPPVPRV